MLLHPHLTAPPHLVNSESAFASCELVVAPLLSATLQKRHPHLNQVSAVAEHDHQRPHHPPGLPVKMQLSGTGCSIAQLSVVCSRYKLHTLVQGHWGCTVVTSSENDTPCTSLYKHVILIHLELAGLLGWLEYSPAAVLVCLLFDLYEHYLASDLFHYLLLPNLDSGSSL